MIDIQTLGNLCSKVEGLVPGSVAGLTISNPGYTHIERALFPSLPYSFSAAITHVPLEPADFGSCVKAISVGRPITCPDIQSDRLFGGLRAIQSRPIFVDGKPRGTFVLAFREPKSESDWDVALMTFAADAASKALSNNETG